MARPKVAKTKKKIVAFRVTEDEENVVLKKLECTGVKVSDYARHAFINSQAEIVAAPVQSEVDRRQLFIISKASNNLNQLAHVMNAARLKGDIDRELCIDLLTKLDLISRYLKASL